MPVCDAALSGTEANVSRRVARAACSAALGSALRVRSPHLTESVVECGVGQPAVRPLAQLFVPGAAHISCTSYRRTHVTCSVTRLRSMLFALRPRRRLSCVGGGTREVSTSGWPCPLACLWLRISTRGLRLSLRTSSRLQLSAFRHGGAAAASGLGPSWLGGQVR